MAGRRKDSGGEDLKRLEDRLAEVARRSPWSAYVMKNFDALTTMIKQYGAHWDTIVAWAIDEGHVDKDKGLSPDAARKAYERERDRRRKAPEQTKTDLPTAPAVRMFPVSPTKPDNQDKADPQQPTDKPDALEDFKRDLGSIGKYGGKN